MATLAALRQDPHTWTTARDTWLESLRSPHTRRAYRSALARFTKYTQKPLHQVAGADVIAYQSHLRKKKLSPATINQHLAALSSYYTYCRHAYTIYDPDTGQNHPLALHNPADKPQRAQPKPYRKAVALTPDQARDLLLAIDRSTIAGRRNYAIVVSYLLTGFRNNELRTLKWGDIRKSGNLLTCTWSGKGGKTDIVIFPWPAYHSITDYLKAAGRLPQSPTADSGNGYIKPGDPIFTATTDVAQRLPNVHKHDPDRPLSGAMINNIVKAAAGSAGLNLDITTHTLRHTAAMLRKSRSSDLQDLQQFLHHSSLQTTQIYIDHLTVKPDPLANQIAMELGIQ
jgi:integrase/recombinase XerC